MVATNNYPPGMCYSERDGGWTYSDDDGHGYRSSKMGHKRNTRHVTDILSDGYVTTPEVKTEKEQFICPKCDKIVDTKEELQEHASNAHGIVSIDGYLNAMNDDRNQKIQYFRLGTGRSYSKKEDNEE